MTTIFKRAESNEVLIEMIKTPEKWEGLSIPEVQKIIAKRFNCTEPARTTVQTLYDSAGLTLVKRQVRLSRADNRQRSLAKAVLEIQVFLESAYPHVTDFGFKESLKMIAGRQGDNND